MSDETETANGEDHSDDLVVKTQVQKEPRKVIECTWPTLAMDLNDIVEAWGADVVLAQALRNARVGFQSRVRALHERGHTEADIQTQMTDWGPHLKAERTPMSDEEKLKKIAASMDQTQLQALLAELQADQQ